MKKQIFIAYYRNAEDNQDAEIYIGETGAEKEFIKYFKMANDIKLSADDINGIYPVVKEFGIDGKEFKIEFTKLSELPTA